MNERTMPGERVPDAVRPTVERDAPPPSPSRRRFFLRVLGLSALTAGLGFPSKARAERHRRGSKLTRGDAAILRFVAAAEILETDLWQQYKELAEGNPAYNAALNSIDEDMTQYVHDNTDDEDSHQKFLNAFLASMGESPVDLDAFRTLPSSPATGAAQIGRLTNLTKLTVDTSWYTRYRGTGNPDFGDTFPQAVTIVGRPAIPLHDGYTQNQIQAIANTAAFHFATIEQGGSSLYASMVPKGTAFDVLRILAGIGGVEVDHFSLWHDTVGNVQPLDTGDGLVFPDLNANPDTQTNLILPEPCKFIREDLPLCSVIRPTLTEDAGAVAAVAGLTASGLFDGQSNAFFKLLNSLATQADRARRTDGDED